MLFDLHDIEYFSMTYVFAQDNDDDVVCEYEQDNAATQVAADGKSVTFTLKNIDASEDDEDYITTIIKEADDEYYLKSTYFEDPEELYPLNLEIFDEEVRFTSAGEGEALYLSGFFA
jgi:hypothetical protein